MQSGSAANTMRLGDYFELVRRHWLTVLICLALGAGAAIAYIQLAPREYQTQASVPVTPTTADAPAATDRTSGINLDTEAQLVTATQTVADAAKQLHLPADQLADKVG